MSGIPRRFAGGIAWSFVLGFGLLSVTRVCQAADLKVCPAPVLVERFAKRWIKHKVVPMEGLAQIAHRYGVTVAEIKRWNELPVDREKVGSGTTLRIRSDHRPPPRTLVRYIVQESDTWWRVAVRHGADSKDLRAYNWPYRDKMTPGSTVKVWADPLVAAWVGASEPVFPDETSRTVRRGAVGIGPPDDGQLLNGVRIPSGEGYELRFPETAFGTSFAVEALLTGIERFRTESGYAGELLIGSMSAARGGPIGTHRSHQTGRDVDIRLPRRAGVPTGIPLTPRRIDWVAAWELIKAFELTSVEVMFLDYPTQKRVYRAAVAAGAAPEELDRLLQYPRGSHARLGLVRHVAGHDQHMHIRFLCGPCELECVDTSDQDEHAATEGEGAPEMPDAGGEPH